MNNNIEINVKKSFQFLVPKILVNYFKRGDVRSVNTKKNIAASFIIKGLNVLISLILVPLTIHYITPSQYGIWLTLTTVISWFSFFDIGFGNGLRNKFAEAVAKGQDELAQIYVSTTYAILSGIVLLVLGAFFIINPFLNWSYFLNAKSVSQFELSVLALVVFVFFCCQFVLQLINTVLTANQQPSKALLFSFFGNLFSLLLIFILIKTRSFSLIYLALSLGCAPVIVLLIASLWFYSRDYKKYAPKLKCVQYRHASSLLNIGLKFFVIQIGALVIFQTDNIIIAQLFGPSDVTSFNVTYKLFSIINMVFFIVITPLWSAFTDAYNRNEMDWIKGVLSKMHRFWLLLVLVTVIILGISPYLFSLWLGDAVYVSWSLSCAMAINGIALSWQSIHVYLLNGIGKIKLQVYLILISALVNIPLAIFLGKEFGLAGVTSANTIVFVLMGVFFAIQCKRILNKTAKNIWCK